MTDQLPLRYDDAFADTEAWALTLEHAKRVVAALGLKEVAHRLNMQPSLLAHKLAERNGNHLSGPETQAVLTMSGDKKLAASFVAPGGFDVVEANPLTAEQKCARYESVIASMPEPIRAAFLKEAGLK
jgi:hypothetical protein